MNYHQILRDLKPQKDFFVGIDSDGCVFDTMEVKQKEFFIPNGIKHFNLFAISKIVRETWEFVNLYSIHRGVNRFPALIKVFDLLSERIEIKAGEYKLPDMDSLRKWVSLETKLGNNTLRAYYDKNPDPVLKQVLNWTETINKEIGDWLKGIDPFLNVHQSLMAIRDKADAIVVSQTPLEALEREWKEHDIDNFVRVIAGQEHGTKSEHIALAAKGKYSNERIILIGDAPGDLKAARENEVCFYPVIPGKESLSWKKFHTEALGVFLKGKYKGKYEDNLLVEFNKALPERPPWD